MLRNLARFFAQRWRIFAWILSAPLFKYQFHFSSSFFSSLLNCLPFKLSFSFIICLIWPRCSLFALFLSFDFQGFLFFSFLILNFFFLAKRFLSFPLMTKSSLDDFLVLVSRVPGTAYQCLHKKFGLRAFVASEVFHKGRYRSFFKQRCNKQNVAGSRCYKNKLEHYRGQDTLFF